MLNINPVFGLIYLVSAAYFFKIWYSYFQQDSSLTEQDRLLSLGILLVATIFWPVVVPISYLELLNTNRLQADAQDIVQLVQLKQQLLFQKAQIEQLQQQLAHAQSTHPLIPNKVSNSGSQMGTLAPENRNFSLIS